MVSKGAAFGLIALQFVGWTLVMAGTAYVQHAHGNHENAFNHSSTDGVESPTGSIFSYAWWVVSFQFVVTLLNAYVVAKAPHKKIGAALVTAVLTAVTFEDTNTLYAGSVSDIVTTMSGEHISPTTKLNAPSRGAIVLMAGLIIVDVANILVTFFLPELEAEAPAAAAPAPAKGDDAPAPAAEAAV